MAHLIISHPNGGSEEFSLSRLRTTIGRSARSDICIPDAFASRLHAEIRREGDSFWLNDLGSANGTRLNGQPIKGPTPLPAGSLIQIGETKISFHPEQSGNRAISSALIADTTDQLDPINTIALPSKRFPTTEIVDATISSRSDLLALISKVGVTLLSSKHLDETLENIASLVFEAVPASRVVIMLRDDGPDGELQLKVARERGIETPNEVRISRAVLDEVLKNGNSVLTADAQHDPKFGTQTIMLQGIRSVLAVPLSVTEDEVFGIIYADSPTHHATFSKEHLDILTTLASVASIRVENARLVEERINRERMERELELASEIQQRFQPSKAPEVEGYEMQGISFSCYEVGGDYYDFIMRPNGKLLFALGDVSGKGTAAALLMSSLHAAMHAQAATEASLKELVCNINVYLTENTPTNRFVTLFVGELDSSDGRIEFINAGQNPPLVCRAAGKTEELASGGFPLGLMDIAEYEAETLVIEPGDTLVIYSDGVSEANDPEGEEFGTERLKNVVLANREKSVSAIRDKIESALSSFMGSAPANDDITLLILKRAG